MSTKQILWMVGISFAVCIAIDFVLPLKAKEGSDKVTRLNF